MERRIAAVLAMDVVGYSQLVQQDEESTLKELATLKDDVLRPNLQVHGGETVKDMGDGWLALFPSTTAAIQCAIDIQTRLSEHRTIKLRMGVHSGDIVRSDTDIFGDCVNLAARLEALSAPGGLLVSDSTWRSLPNPLAKDFCALGETKLKNMKGSHRLYGWGNSRSLNFDASEPEPIGLSEIPTIAILPFDNLSGEPDLGHLADGMTENLIAILSTSPNLMVTARNSSFVFKGKATPVSEVSATLGVQYVVEGSLQAAGDRLRVTVQLIDAVTGTHMWADRYDRSLDDIFDVQDDIAHRVCVELHVKLTYGVHVRHRCKDVESLTLYTVGRTHFNFLTPHGLQIATENWTRFHQKDSENPEGLCLMGWLAWMRVFLGVSSDPMADLGAARGYGERSISIDPTWGNGHRILGITLLFLRDFDAANVCFDKAIELNPSDGEAISIGGNVRCFSGRYEEAEGLWLRSLKLEPFAPTWIPLMLATVRLVLGKHSLARSGFDALAQGDEEAFVQASMAWLVILNSIEGDTGSVDVVLRDLRSRFPDFSLASFQNMWLRLWKDEEMANRFADYLRTAGLPEH